MYSLFILYLGMFCISRETVYIFVSGICSFVCSGNIFSRGKEEVAKGDGTPLRRCLLRVSFTSIRGVASGEARNV